MTSRIKHLQHAKLYPSTHVTNTKSMTPNQLRFRASGLKGFRHIPHGPCSVSRQSVTAFILLFLLFFFFLLFLFLFGRLHWPSYIGNTNLLWVLNKSKAGFARRKKVHNFTTYWYNLVCSVCISQRGNVQG